MNKKQWKCIICGETFDYYVEAVKHLHEKHPNHFITPHFQQFILFTGVD